MLAIKAIKNCGENEDVIHPCKKALLPVKSLGRVKISVTKKMLSSVNQSKD